MANIDWIEGKYTIAGNATKDHREKFYYWWPGADAKQFFDVSVSPLSGSLRERARVRYYDASSNNYVLMLELQNQGTESVDFVAHHVRIYD